MSSVLPIALSGMNAAAQRLPHRQAAATSKLPSST
jgi:hypothetical protein